MNQFFADVIQVIVAAIYIPDFVSKELKKENRLNVDHIPSSDSTLPEPVPPVQHLHSQCTRSETKNHFPDYYSNVKNKLRSCQTGRREGIYTLYYD